MASGGPQIFTVPAGTREEACRSCQSAVYWITTAGGKKMPVDCDVPEGHEPTGTSRDAGSLHDGRGVSHFITCPQRDAWRKKKPSTSER